MREKERRGNVTILLPHLCLKVAPCSSYRESHMLSLSYTGGNFTLQNLAYIKDSHQYMKVTTQETLYHEDHGATLKHKCGKKEIVALSLLSFSLIYLFFFFICFLWPSFFFLAFLFFYSSLETVLQKMMIITLLFIYNSMITT